jgi:hypothetical protein
MVNKKFYLGILVMVLVFGMTVVGNLEAQTENGGEFILTDLPAKYNGKYVLFIPSGNSNVMLSITGEGAVKTFPIIDGKVIIPLWFSSDRGRNFERYYGNDTFAIFIVIYEKEDFQDINNKILERFEFNLAKKFGGLVDNSNSVQFSNGSATRSYKNRSSITRR